MVHLLETGVACAFIVGKDEGCLAMTVGHTEEDALQPSLLVVLVGGVGERAERLVTGEFLAFAGVLCHERRRRQTMARAKELWLCWPAEPRHCFPILISDSLEFVKQADCWAGREERGYETKAIDADAG